MRQLKQIVLIERSKRILKFKTGSMIIFLQCQFQKLKTYSIKKTGSSGIKLLGCLFFIASVFFSKESYATIYTSFGSANITPASTTFCAGDSTTLTLTGVNGGGIVGTSNWSANYQWDSSSDGVHFFPIAGATGTISFTSPTATYNTSALNVTTFYYVELTSIVSSSAGPAYTTATVTVNVLPVPAAINGNPNVCVGATDCLTDATAGGTWSSTNTLIATIGTTGCVFGIGTGSTTIVYGGSDGCSVVYSVTVNATAPIAGASAVCYGSTITLSDATAGVTWSSSNTSIATVGSSSGVVTGASTTGGAVTILATSPVGCVAIKTINVNPDPAAIAGNNSICFGLTNCLSETTAGGTWSSSNTSVATVASTGCVTGSNTGTATISYTLGTSCFNTTTVTVNPLPGAILGTASVCVGSTTSLSDATTGGTWTSSNTSVATINGSGVVTGVTAGTSTIIYTSPLGCTVSTVITVNPWAPITGDLNVCLGLTTTLSDAATGGTWSSSNGNATVGSSTGIVTGAFLGLDTITYTLPFGCTATAVVTVDPNPTGISGISTVCVGSSTALTDAGGGTWSTSNTTVLVGSSTGIVTGVTSGTAMITYTLATGCFTTYSVTINPVSPISGTLSVCVGNTTALTNTTGGGAWSSSNGAVGTVDGFGNVTGIASGTTIISYSLASGCYATATVTVNPLPNPINGNASVCAWGGMSCLSDEPGGGEWSSTLIVVNTIGCVTGYDTGVGTLTYTLPTGCMVTLSVTVNPLPDPITGNTTVCQGYSTTLNDGTPLGTWSSSNTSIATVGSTTGVVSGVSGGTADITYTIIATGCTADTSVLVNPGPANITGVGSVCVGLTTALTDATGGGTWSSNNGNASVGSTGIVTGNLAGTSIISYTLPTGCYVTTIVTINPLPSGITGPSGVCVGSTITLNDLSGGGTWASSNTSVATIGTDGVVTGITPGTTTITYTLGTGCLITTVITVNPINQIAGNFAVCVGLTTTLTDTTTGGTWSSSSIATATIGSTSGIVTGVAGGTTTIVYTTAFGCTASAVVTVNPLPLGITGVETVCEGYTTQLNDGTAGGNWSSGASGIASIGATGLVSGNAGGTATITYTLGTGCLTTAVVTVYPLTGITGTASVCQGSTISLTDATAGGTWSSTNTAVGTVSTTGIVYGASAGTTTISYILPTGCYATTVVTVNALGPVLGGNVGLCIGFSITLSDVATGGTWTSSNPGIGSVGEFTGVVTGVSTGVVTITDNLPGGCTASTTVTVNAIASISGPDSVCQGSITQFSDATAGGTWSSSNIATGTISATGSFNADGTSSGTTILSYTYGANCYTTYPLIVNPMTAILGATNVCPGSNFTLSDTTAGGIWSSSNTIIGTVGSTSGVVSALEPGTVTIIYMVSTGCTATSTVTVDVVYPITGNLSLCLGGTTNLTDITTGGTWSSNNAGVAGVGSTGVVTAVTVGTADITYTQPGGCTAVVTVTVNPSPAPITGPTQICVGAMTTLSDPTLGGIWSSTDVVVSGSGNVAGVTAYAVGSGVATITYELTPSGCQVYYQVTVNPEPSNINGILVVCQGLTSTLSDVSTVGTWSSTNTGIATVGSTTGIVTGVSQGLDTIVYTLSTGCSTDTAFNVNGLPSPITGVTEVCFGLTTDLTDASVGGTWSSSNPLIGSVNTTGVVTGTGSAGGTVIITYTLPTGCINTVVVTVNPLPGPITGPSSVCVGQTITLVDAGGGTWISTNIFVATIGSTTGIVTGVSQGASVITYTLGTGCITTTTVNVNPLSNITGTMSLCVGLTTDLTDATTGGTWSSTNTSVATIGTSGIVSGVTAGTSTISYVTPAGCITTTVVTVNPLPTVISGVPIVCVGQTTSLSDGTGGGVWTSSNTTVATVGSSSGIVTGMSPGTSTIVYTLGSGCTEKIIVTVNPLAPISGSTSLCVGQATTFSDAVAGTWTSSNTSVATIGSSTGIATGISVGTATIVFVTGTGCTTSIIVTVNPLAPISGTTELCEGVTTIFTDAVTGGTWTSSNTAIATVEEVTGVVTAGSTGGVVTIDYITTAGCTASISVTVTALGAINGPSSVCQGDSISLSDATAGGVWSVENSTIGSISSTGEFTGISSGTDIVSYSYGPSCVAFKAINIDPSTPIVGDFNICKGFTTTLTDATLGGTWSSSDPVIASVTPEGIIGGFETVVVNGNNVGTDTIIYILPTGCRQTAVVTVNLTAAIAGADSVCVGLTTTLSDATAGVTWSSSNNTIAIVGSATGIVTGESQGIVTITATSPVGCLATVVVTVNPLPSAILGTPVVCVGLTTTLSDLTLPGTWSSSNPGIATINSTTGLLTGVTAGTAIITWTLPTGCYATVVATVDPLPAAISGTLNVCVGLGTILTDATAGGTWSASNTNATIGSNGVAIGNDAGLDTITYTLGTGCIITAVLTVNPLPSNIQGNPNICLGSTNVLSDTTLGGTWSSSNTNATVVSSAGDGVSIFGNNLGSAIITYTLPTGCITILPVSVDPLPLAITGIDSVCVGSETSLSDPTFGGTWTSLNTGVALVGSSTGIVTGVSADTVTIVYTLGSGCTATVVVTVNPLPLAITGNFNVCIGTSNTLGDGTNGGTWSSSQTLVATIGSNTGIVQGISLGTALITYTLNTGCFVTQEVTVDPLPLAITGIDSVCVGSTTDLFDATTGGDWSSSNTSVATIDGTTGIVTGVSAGTTTITYQLTATGCISTVIVTVNPLPSAISGRNTICVGITYLLTDPTAGGTWSSTNTSAATIGSATGDYTGVFSDTSTGTIDTIIYTLPTGCSASYQVTVYPNPPAIMGPDSVCVASTVQLSETAAFAGGTWSSSLPDTASISSVGGLVFGLSQGTTVITFTSNQGCINTVVMTVNPIPTPIYTADSVCNGFSVQLHDNSAGGVWSTTNAVIDSVNSTGLVFGLSPGSDSILYTYPVTGCRAVLLFTVHPIPVITINSSDNQQICIGASVLLTASGAGPNPQPYVWTPTTALVISPGGTPVTASPTVTTIYTVVGTTQYGCSSYAIDTVHVDSLLLHIHITGRDSICEGAYDTLIAGPTYIGAPLFAWTPNNAISTSPADTVYVNPTITETYTAVLIDSFGCADSASFKVTVNPLPIISVSPNPGIVCRGSSTQFTATGAGAGGSYAWYPNAFLSCDSCNNPYASDTQNLVYNVYGKTVYGCVDSIYFPVSVLDTTKITISNDTVICAGQCVNLMVTSSSKDGSHPISYAWSNSNGTQNIWLNEDNGPFVTACPDSTINYKVIVKENVCFSDTSHVIVFVEPIPAISITATPNTNVLAGQPVTLSATITNGALLNDYAWIPAMGLSCEKCYDPIATPTATTTYTFSATSNYGCVAYDTITINLTCGVGQVFIPNTFTPNGDGHNDRFYVSGTGISNITSMRIYNRWGELVFQSENTSANDPGAGWDGTYKGIVLEPDVFVYVVQVQCELGGQPFDFKGNVSLVR